jgi:hypothetical protein
MARERALKVVLVVVGLLFTAAIYIVVGTLWHRDQPGFTDAMMLSLYFVLGVLLLRAVPNPAAHRSLIAFAAWSSLAHGAVMTVMAFEYADERGLLPGVAILGVIGIALLALAPRKTPAERATAAGS